MVLIASGVVASMTGLMAWGGERIIARRTSPGSIALPPPADPAVSAAAALAVALPDVLRYAVAPATAAMSATFFPATGTVTNFPSTSRAAPRAAPGPP